MYMEILIKKYRNRKLYNTKSGFHVSLFEIAELIWRGYTVRVITHDGKTDISHQVLERVRHALALKTPMDSSEDLHASIKKYGGA